MFNWIIYQLSTSLLPGFVGHYQDAVIGLKGLSGSEYYSNFLLNSEKMEGRKGQKSKAQGTGEHQTFEISLDMLEMKAHAHTHIQSEHLLQWNI